MDRFDDDRPELSGSLISMEFGPGGRITQLWATDPALPEEGEEFQFVLPPIQFGEESADDYLPGTILIGARTGPDQPWIVSRNSTATQVYDFDSEEGIDPGVVVFDYVFPLLEDIQARGRFFEVVGTYPQVVWEVEIRNNGRQAVEIGELGFPLAFNNLYDGFGWSDEQLRRLWNSRVYMHKFIGGGASWLFAQRMTAEAPGLLVYPGDGTGWEFTTSVRGSLNTPYQWEGIPVVYVHSKATIEREEWPEWMNGHTSLILEPGDHRTYQMRFVAAESDKQDGVNLTLAACGHPTVRILPSAVVPVEVGIGLEISGTVPAQFSTSRDAQMETDVDEEGGFCFVRPREPGPLRVSFQDGQGRLCHVHLMFTEPIAELVRKRAKYVASKQRVDQPDSLLHHAFVLANAVDGQLAMGPEEYAESSGIECSFSDALFLAAKNALYPERSEIGFLDDYIDDFLLDDVQDPASHAVGSVIAENGGVGAYFGRPLGYPHVFNLYHTMYRIAGTYGETRRAPADYLRHAFLTADAMFQQGWRLYVRTVGVLGYARIYDLLTDLRREGMTAEADRLQRHVEFKAAELMKLKYPYAGESVTDTSGFEEVFAAAKHTADDDHLERTVRCAFATRSLAPSWWWYGSDKRSWDGADSSPLRALVDRGEACLAHTTIPNSLIFFGLMDRDYLALPEAYMRMAFGGMMGPWALVRRDGASSMCYCPDLSSKNAGYNPFTGTSGLGYFHYLIGAGAFVLPNRGASLFTFGCHYESDENVYIVQPWDGVGRRIVLRQIGAEFELDFGRFVELQLDHRKRWFETVLENPSDKDVQAQLRVRGLWGTELTVQGRAVSADGGEAVSLIELPARQRVTVTGKVTK